MRRQPLPAVLILSLLAFLGRSANAAPASQPARPTTAVDPAGCVTDQCHVGVKAHKVTHAPVEMNACDACHKLTDPLKHTYEPRRQGAAACTYCHEFDVEGIPVVHTPVARGECLGCHNPHGGVDRRMTRETTIAELCARCHDDVKRDRKHAHDPVAKGACDSCHTSHASKFPRLLYAEGDALCFSCHDKFQDQLGRAKFRHGAMGEGCDKCHESHAADLPKQLKRAAPELCTDACHEDVKRTAARSKFAHSVVLKDRSCLTCHTPHGADLASLMVDTPVNVCMSCHVDKQKTARGYVVAALPELKDPLTHKHGPINDGLCSACHQSHGSDEPQLLLQHNSTAFYQPLAEENYRLCFACHDIGMGQKKQTHTATQFRNGETNLHFVHTNRGTRGRNCRACHNTHASANPDHVNDSLQFGQWKMPINFKKTATGGTCTTGCHPEWPYDRVRAATRPVRRSTTGPATSPSPEPDPVIAEAPHRTPATASDAAAKPPPVRWELTTAAGARVKVPHPAGRPTVLVFTRAGHAQQDDLFRLIATAAPDDRRASVLLVIAGEGSADEAKRLAAAKSPRWPIVPDPDDALAGQLQVHVWPTTLVVSGDGAQVARFAGAPESISFALPAHVDFAAGRITRAALADRLAVRSAVGDTPERKASRAAQAAARKREAGDPKEAARLASEALKTYPASVEIRTELARALIDADDVRALKVIDQLPADALPPGLKPLLRARALLAREDWSAARTALEAAITENPALDEAHYLMGRLHERDGNWPAAARSYRAAREIQGD